MMRHMYVETNTKVEKLCESIKFKCMGVFLQGVTFSKILYSFFNYFFTDLGSDAFVLPFYMWQDFMISHQVIKLKSIFLFNICIICRYPFDWKNPTGYLAACFIQYVGLVHLFYFIAFCICLQIGVYLWVTAFHKNLKRDLKLFNQRAKSQDNRTEILIGQFHDLIQFHSFLIQLSE